MSWLEENARNMLDMISGLPLNDEAHAIKQIQEESIQRKQALIKRLGMTSYKYEEEIEISLDPSSNISKVLQLLFCVMPEKDLSEFLVSSSEARQFHRSISESLQKIIPSTHVMDYIKMIEVLTKGTMNSGKKITKHLRSCFYTDDGMKRYFDMCNVMSANSIYKALPKLNSDKYLYTQYLEIMQSITELISTNTRNVLGFAVDFLSIFNCLNSNCFTSCMKANAGLDSSYSASPIVLARSNAGVIYVRNDKDVIGRCLVAFSDCNNSFSIKKTYGSISNAQVMLVANWLKKSLNKNLEWQDTRSWNTHFRTNFAYDDPSVLTTTCLTLNGSNVYYNSITLDSPRCIICGVINEEGMLCSSCRKKFTQRCVDCGALLMDEESINAGICRKCAKKHEKKVCEKCGATLVKNHRTDEEYCPVCKMDNTCFICNKQSDKLEDVNGTKMCPSCKENIKKTKCAVCGGDHDLHMLFGDMVCDHCETLLLSILSTHVHINEENKLIIKDSVSRIRFPSYYQYISQDMIEKYVAFLNKNINSIVSTIFNKEVSDTGLLGFLNSQIVPPQYSGRLRLGENIYMGDDDDDEDDEDEPNW